MSEATNLPAYQDLIERVNSADSVPEHIPGGRLTDADLRSAVIDRYIALFAVVGEVCFLFEQALDGRHGSAVPAGSVYAELSATLTGLIGAIGMAGASRFIKWMDNLFLVPRYLTCVLGCINILESLNGFGRPDIGREFKDDSEVFSGLISDLLYNAAPIDWCGKAAAGYEGQNIGLRAALQEMADADQKVAETLTTQAGQVEIGRETFASIESAIGLAIIYAVSWAIYIKSIFLASPLEAKESADRLDRFGLTVAFLAAGGLLAMAGFLIGEGLLHIHDFNEAKRSYQRAAGVDQAGTDTAAPGVPPTASASTISGFPDLTSSAQNERAAVNASDLPAFVSPPRAELSQAPQHAAHLSKQASPYIYLANQMQGQAQHVSSQVQQLAAQPQQTPSPGNAHTAGKDEAAAPAVPADLVDDADAARAEPPAESTLAQRMAFDEQPLRAPSAGQVNG